MPKNMYCFCVSMFDRTEVENWSGEQCEAVWKEHLEDDLLPPDKETGLEVPPVDKLPLSDTDYLQDWLNDQCSESYWVRII